MRTSQLPARIAGVLICAFLPEMPMADATPQTAGRVTGIGGVFVTSKDPKALTAWYRDMLGVDLKPWGGVVFRNPGPTTATWAAFADKDGYFAPSHRDLMINFIVDDLDALLARLTAKGVAILKRDELDPHGRFAWILDPDGTKIELWQPTTP